MTGPLAFAVKPLHEQGALHAEKTLDAELFKNCLDGEGSLTGPVAVELDLSADEGNILCQGLISGQWTLECCRCLAPSPARYDAEFSATLTELEGWVDASEEVRQALILAIPSTRYCRENCKGLCSQCGANRNEKTCGCSQPPEQPNRFKVTKRGDHHA